MLCPYRHSVLRFAKFLIHIVRIHILWLYSSRNNVKSFKHSCYSTNSCFNILNLCIFSSQNIYKLHAQWSQFPFITKLSCVVVFMHNVTLFLTPFFSVLKTACTYELWDKMVLHYQTIQRCATNMFCATVDSLFIYYIFNSKISEESLCMFLAIDQLNAQILVF